jgi:hypothetical protein
MSADEHLHSAQFVRPMTAREHLRSIGIEEPEDPGPYQPGPEWDAKRTAFEQYARKRNLVAY